MNLHAKIAWGCAKILHTYDKNFIKVLYLCITEKKIQYEIQRI